jgi:hypothetical protein
MTQLSFTVARRIATSLESASPGVVCMISDVPQRGKVKELAFKVTVWEASPDMHQNVNKFTIVSEEEYDRIETIISTLNLTNHQQVTNEQAVLK